MARERRFRLAVAAGAAVLLAVGIGTMGYLAVSRALAAEQGPRQAAEALVRALAAGDVQGAAAQAAGPLAAVLRQRATETLPTARITGLDVEVTAVGEGWAAARARAEAQLRDGTWDVMWLDLRLTTEGGAWRVTTAEQVGPKPEGRGGKVPGDFSGQALEEYLEALKAGRWEEATGSLVGPARRAHEAGRSLLGGSGSPIIGSYTKPAVRALWAQQNLVVAEARYEADARPVRLLIAFARTGGGWKIAEIGQA